jgi:hypothetical protein
MIISDLNYVEVVTEASEVQGGLSQNVGISQTAVAAAGNNGGNGISLFNTAAAVNVALPTVFGLEAFTVGGR